MNFQGSPRKNKIKDNKSTGLWLWDCLPLDFLTCHLKTQVAILLVGVRLCDLDAQAIPAHYHARRDLLPPSSLINERTTDGHNRATARDRHCSNMHGVFERFADQAIKTKVWNLQAASEFEFEVAHRA